ncbi:hypothetical protein F2Q70_00011358 [Brassica cretica]|uniref:Uncharacterized protein n=2 Tax=Brassica cretica TaxID=69181 RepID=A0A8S9JCM0_BRACR|nr:hypothetical protein F2Q68_00004494 [Brassica cretica]KAF2614186.1 hypothetical protein F2Q70_00011358 [Brassica cretica]KAF3507956.1 hypothetical protein F2Q69_00005840 [Brassica cretica]KAF3548817.1 hypothetical protein DY000_02006572 [Brassica cretica]
MEPVSVSKLSGGGNDETGGSPWGRDQGKLIDVVQREVTDLLQPALDVAHLHLSEDLKKRLSMVIAPEGLVVFVKVKQEALFPARASSC